MDLLNELARTDIDPALLAQVQALITQQQAKIVDADHKLARLDAVLAENDFKIKALTFELAYYKRVRFGKASEALVGEQRMLFDETVDMDRKCRRPVARRATRCSSICHVMT
jgi:transposase